MNKNIVYLVVVSSLFFSCINAEPDKGGADSQGELKKSRKLQNIEKIVALTTDKTMLSASMKSNFQQMIQQVAREASAKQVREISKAADDLFDVFLKEFKAPSTMQRLYALYDKIYTEQEIEELLKFYESPVGKKTLQKLPEVTSTIASITAELMQKHLQGFTQQVFLIMAGE